MFDAFDRVEIIHLRERRDRYDALRKELGRLGFPIERARIPDAPRPGEANGFPSKGVYGNFLSHLDIIRRAQADHLESVLVLEDDAIFRRLTDSEGARIADTIKKLDWDLLFIGHSLRNPPPSDSGFIPPTADFYWAHCYAVRARVLSRLTKYLESVIERPAKHPLGGRMYIDASFTLFRHQNPDVKCLISSPRLSIQRGSESSLGGSSRLAHLPFLSSFRWARDEMWRYGLLRGGP